MGYLEPKFDSFVKVWFYLMAYQLGKVGDHSWGQPKDSLFNNYYTKV